MSRGPKGWWARHIDSVYRLVLLALVLLWVVYPPHAAQPRPAAPALVPMASAL